MVRGWKSEYNLGEYLRGHDSAVVHLNSELVREARSFDDIYIIDDETRKKVFRGKSVDDCVEEAMAKGRYITGDPVYIVRLNDDLSRWVVIGKGLIGVGIKLLRDRGRNTHE